jgi:hypothetical protein
LEAKAGGLIVQGQSQLHNETKQSKGKQTKEKRKEKKKKKE